MKKPSPHLLTLTKHPKTEAKLRFADSQRSRDWLFGQKYQEHYLTCIKEKKIVFELYSINHI